MQKPDTAWGPSPQCRALYGPAEMRGSFPGFPMLNPGEMPILLPVQSMAAPPPRPSATTIRTRATPPDAARELRGLLARMVETEVVPRLVMAHRAMLEAASIVDCAEQVEPAPQPGPEDVVALVALVTTRDVETALAFVEDLRARGTTLDRIYLDLFAPTARRLGQLWLEDLCSFADVTVGLGRLQVLMRQFGPSFLPDDCVVRDRRRRALLAPAPGEQHCFGVMMVAEFFLRAGWNVWTEPRSTGEALAGIVHENWFAVVGLSVGCETALETLPDVIRDLRRASRNRTIGVMVGGPAFNARPELVRIVGADATASDGRQAALQAETFFALAANQA